MADELSSETLRVGRDLGPALEVHPVGGMLLRATLMHAGSPVDIVAPVAAIGLEAARRRYANVPLFPFPNRLDAGRYEHEGVERRFPINEAETNTALHGLLFRERVQLSRARGPLGAFGILAEFEYDGGYDYYPFPCSVGVRTEIQGGARLAVTIEVLNLGTTTMPVGVGWHPYFAVPARELWLELPPLTRCVLDRRGLPTGSLAAFDDFREAAPLGNLELDDAFRLADASNGARCRLLHPAAGYELELWQDAAFGYLQVFTPPDRESVAVEPMSMGVNALATGEGVRRLKPRERFVARCGVSLRAGS